jgi:flap endonuclease-1
LLKKAGKSGSTSLCQINLQTVLETLKWSMAQFVDFCILCGCDYTETLKGIGPVRAYEGINTHKSIDALLVSDSKLEAKGMDYKGARHEFKAPQITSPTECKLSFRNKTQEAELKAFLINYKFQESRITKGLLRLKEAKRKLNQTSLGLTPNSSFAAYASIATKKHKHEEEKSLDVNKKIKTSK